MNKELLKNRKVIVATGIVVMLLIFVGAFFLNQKNANQTQNQNSNILPTQIPIPTITADSIGLTLKAGYGGKTVIVSLSSVEGISSIDYELSYISKGDIPRGAIGTLDLTKKPVRKEITLGTCSDVCHYDTDVKDIKIVLKITKTDGKVFQTQQSLASLNQ